MLRRLVNNGDDIGEGGGDAADAFNVSEFANIIEITASAVGSGTVLTKTDVLLSISFQWNGKG